MNISKAMARERKRCRRKYGINPMDNDRVDEHRRKRDIRKARKEKENLLLTNA